MQSGQVPNIGVLQAKKGWTVRADVDLKAYVKYKNIGSGIKSLNGIPIWRTLFRILDKE